jgi:hypothetical protein
MFKHARALIPVLAISALAPLHAQVVATIAGFRATYPAGKIGGSSATGLPANYVNIPPANEYYLDYEVIFETGWIWNKGGKLPGLVGGAHTSGCDPIVKDGWSARFMWHGGGGGHFYYYHQNRVNDCGDEINFSGNPLMKIDGKNRITEHVVINTPGQSDGSAEAWLNGKKIITLNGVKWRGSVAATVAMVDQVSLQTFYGGSTTDWAPSATTHSTFTGFVVRKDLPDFAKPFEPVTTGVISRDGSGNRPGESAGLPAGAVRGIALAYLGDGRLPAEMPEAEEGVRAALHDIGGRQVATLVRVRENWIVEAGSRLPMRAGVLAFRTLGASAGNGLDPHR